MSARFPFEIDKQTVDRYVNSNSIREFIDSTEFTSSFEVMLDTHTRTSASTIAVFVFVIVGRQKIDSTKGDTDSIMFG